VKVRWTWPNVQDGSVYWHLPRLADRGTNKRTGTIYEEHGPEAAAVVMNLLLTRRSARADGVLQSSLQTSQIEKSSVSTPSPGAKELPQCPQTGRSATLSRSRPSRRSARHRSLSASLKDMLTSVPSRCWCQRRVKFRLAAMPGRQPVQKITLEMSDALPNRIIPGAK
jgi:hypothetical protein